MPEPTREELHQLAEAVSLVFANLSADGAEAFERVCYDEELLYQCRHCGWNLAVDEIDQPCGGCQHPRPLEEDDPDA